MAKQGRNDSICSEDTARDIDTSKVDDDIKSLAKELTRQSTHISTLEPHNPFIDPEKNAILDPNSVDFNAKAWMKNLLALQSRDPERYPRRTAGFAFRNLNVHGFGKPTDYQKDVANAPLEIGNLFRAITGSGKHRIQILRDFSGIVNDGEMLVVLGRPGSGCSTFLKTIAGEMNGIYLGDDSYINYQGIPIKQMHKQFRGEATYTAETDVHFPQLTVGETLEFAARARAPANRIPGVTREQHAIHMRDVVMASFGLNHTLIPCRNDLVRGISERAQRILQTLWNLPDSRLSTDYMGATVCVAIYQASQKAYDYFDKVTVLYEGRQIYFGRTDEAKKFFVDMGFECPERQTTADFLTSLTSPVEHIIRPGFEGKTPITPSEFETAWKNSAAYAKLLQDIEEYETRYPIGGPSVDKFIESRKAQQARSQRVKSPYTISVSQQIGLCVRRGFQRLRRDMSLTLSALIGNFFMSLILGSVFYNLNQTTESFYRRGALLFFAILMSAFASSLEILTLYAQRPIVEKHARYALYHPFTEAISSMLCDLPYKFLNSITFNLPIYFLSNLRREPSAYFVFWLFTFVTTLAMSMIFRTIAATSRTLAQALAPAAVLILGLVIYTGFAIPTRNMLSWARWINYIDPVAYAFEALMVNEFHNRQFECAGFIPSGGEYDSYPLENKVCGTVGSIAGSSRVDGDLYLRLSFQYEYSHIWRNLGIIFAITFFFMFTYLFSTEYISEAKSKGEVLLFRKGHKSKKAKNSDIEASTPTISGEKSSGSSSQGVSASIQKQTAIFQWKDVCYDIKVKKEERRLLDHVDGWVKPGTCTALMGVSGAGKTTLLDVLATRVTMGVVSGEMLVDSQPRDASFQRKTGYIMQQDIHAATSTVREALNFSALLRQPASVPRAEKLAYVDEVIKLLEMEDYADAVVGVPGEGLNVEQRKRLTIGVELAAKPQLLLFLDEPTSGLDSQTSWSILNLLDTLTKHGQAILCTIHQPSAMLFQRFDRLLFLASGGKTVYFGDVGERSSILSSYFERNGASPCPPDANPAEWILEVIGAAPGSKSDIDWPEVWRNSPERKAVHAHLDELKSTLSEKGKTELANRSPEDYCEFAAPFSVQVWECLIRVFSQYWRSPVYIYSKTALCSLSALFVGFSFFNAQTSLQGLQNQMFAVFMLMTILGNLTQQIVPNFVAARALYEARERPSKSYSWKAFMIANISVELPWNTLMAVIVFACWYYPIGLYNAIPSDQIHERGGLMFLLVLAFLLFASTFAHLVIAGVEVAETGANLANLLFMLCLVFCGVLATKEALPGFWVFLYRISPFTYLISAMLSTGFAGADIVCEPVEFLHFNPIANQTCEQYLAAFRESYPPKGYLENPLATSDCGFCIMQNTDTFLASIGSYYSDAWRNFGFMWVYIVFNIVGAVFIYWLTRVPKGAKAKGPTTS
ncbi:multidrug resistance protein [Histoplasma capsulatum H143]|uniref:Multidrug resistance protein n=1 Tax=Ajellomyces capsulatus (strain H143) TaxID=544712 RepID=C6H493_AJECH|nr:multidrug resistance protein [Histoplasma capsulatum H143]